MPRGKHVICLRLWELAEWAQTNTKIFVPAACRAERSGLACKIIDSRTKAMGAGDARTWSSEAPTASQREEVLVGGLGTGRVQGNHGDQVMPRVFGTCPS